jgi:hypothetical protein
VDVANARIRARLEAHAAFVRARYETKGGAFGYRNEPYRFPVVTRQETGLFLNGLREVESCGETEFLAKHSVRPQRRHVEDWEWFFRGREPGPARRPGRRRGHERDPEGDTRQLDLLDLCPD